MLLCSFGWRKVTNNFWISAYYCSITPFHGLKKTYKGGEDGKRKDSRAISRVMSPEAVPEGLPRCFVIYLRRLLPDGCSSLPPDNGRAILKCRYTWPCNPKMCGTSCHHEARWALTPPFHPYHSCGGYFLSHYSTVTRSFPLESVVLCVARTFLTPLMHRRATKRPTV